MFDYRDAESLMDVIREFYNEHKAAPKQILAKEYYGARYSGFGRWHVKRVFRGLRRGRTDYLGSCWRLGVPWNFY
jgi:hypothetical protein